MISVYALVIKQKTGERQLTGVWKGSEKTAPEGCLEMETRNGVIETHYWIVKGDAVPKIRQKCLCKKQAYSEE